jgi:hypothetical protein
VKIRQKRSRQKVRFDVTYGMGGTACGELPRQQIEGKSAREVIQSIAALPQQTESASRTANVLTDTLQTLKKIDAELIRATGDRALGEPIDLDEVVIAGEGDGAQKEGIVGPECNEVTIRLSESYEGGEGSWQIERQVELG